MTVKWDINLGTLLPIGAALLATYVSINERLTTVEVGQKNSESFRVARTSSTDKNFVDLGTIVRAQSEISQKQAIELSNLALRVTSMERGTAEQSKALTERMDRLAESLLGSVRTLSERVSDLNTAQQLTNQKIDSLDVPRNTRRLP